VALSSDDLPTIRRLSQYRPFEGGGTSAREAKQDLLLATLAEAGGSCDSIGECNTYLTTLWGLTFEELELADLLNALIHAGQLNRGADGTIALSPAERGRLEAAAAESLEAERKAFDEWHEAVVQQWPFVTNEELAQLDRHLQSFLNSVVQQHGAEAALLAYPDDPAAQALLEEVNPSSSELPHDDQRERTEWALSMFMREATDAQRLYLAQTLNTAYFVTALTIDPAAARLITSITSGQRVYLDTNFLYRLLGVQGPRYVKASEAILRATQAAGYVCAVTPWTVSEYRLSLERSKKFLELYPVPPDDFAALAADVTSVEDFVTSYWRQVRSTKMDVNDYVAYHSEVESHLLERGIATLDEGVKAIDAQRERILDETSILGRVLYGKYRHPQLVEHDVKHRLLIKRLRGDGNRTFANAGYWFLTHDRVLPRYDLQAERDAPGENPRLPFCVSAGAWFQVVEAFRPKTGDFAQTLADVVASPYIHPRRTITKEAAQAVVARVALYKDGTPELAARVFMNSAAMAEIERQQDPAEQTEAIDNAIVQAAKVVQAEAREARAAAIRDRERAEQLAQEAESRVRQAEEAKREEIGLDRGRHGRLGYGRGDARAALDLAGQR
jgi:predicted nucleic acid-binding protein